MQSLNLMERFGATSSPGHRAPIPMARSSSPSRRSGGANSPPTRGTPVPQSTVAELSRSSWRCARIRTPSPKLRGRTCGPRV
jgi:hypothetical protein